MQAAAQEKTQRLAKDWAALTFRSDHARLGPIPLPVLHLVLAGAALAAAWWLPEQRMYALIALAVGLLFTLGRAAVVMPNRRNKLGALYTQIQKRAGLPRGTSTTPPRPEQHIHVRKWGASGMPLDMTITCGECPAAASVFAHAPLEKAVGVALPETNGQQWVFDWPRPSVCHAVLTPPESPEVARQQYTRLVLSVVASVLKITTRNVDDGFDVQLGQWERKTNSRGDETMVPNLVSIDYASFDASNPSVRDMVERALDSRVPTPGEWLYEWDDTSLDMTSVDASSTEARRKRAQRKMGDNVIGMVRGNDRRADIPVVGVTAWLDHADFPDDHPRKLHIDFGTRNLAARRDRDQFESAFDETMAAAYPQVAWLYDWTGTGAETTLDIACVPINSSLARRKAAERRLRNVVESKFGKGNNFVDCDITAWQKKTGPQGEALPQSARVRFGDYDVTKQETQDAFEQHWDSLTTANDWKYSWSPADGIVEMDAVPPLPPYKAMPDAGTDEFRTLMQEARKGRFHFGPRKGGGSIVWDLNSTPHALFGGKTGSGKSVALSLVLFYGLYNPDLISLIVCDPKRTDFTWTPEFPSVTQFAATDEQIVAAVGAARQEMDRRQNMLSRLQVRNIGQLRELYKRRPELEAEHGPAPRRLILFFDEIADFLAKGANKDIEELKDEARADLEKIGRLGRALEVNIIAAAQKPDAKIISTQLRSQLGFRLGVGPLDQYESEQILNSDHGTRFPSEGVPKGRSWARDPKYGIHMAQVMFLPDDTSPAPWDPSITLGGAKDVVREHLQELGYARTTITNSAGGEETRWVRVED